MGKTKDLFLQMREDELEKELLQERIFIASDEEAAYQDLKELSNKEVGKIIDITRKEEEEPSSSLPF